MDKLYEARPSLVESTYTTGDAIVLNQVMLKPNTFTVMRHNYLMEYFKQSTISLFKTRIPIDNAIKSFHSQSFKERTFKQDENQTPKIVFNLIGVMSKYGNSLQ